MNYKKYFTQNNSLKYFCYSHLHRNVSARFLTCEPNLTNETNYRDEADRFYEDEKHWIRKEILQETRDGN